MKPNPAPEPSPQVADPTSLIPYPPRKRPKRKWRRRGIAALLLVFLIVFALRAALPLVFPAVLSKVAAQYGLEAGYQRVELSVFNGNFALWNLRLWPKGDPASPIITSDYTYGNISVWQLLFHRRLFVLRAEADGVNLNATRQPDGKVPYFDEIFNSTKSSASSGGGTGLANANGDILEPPLTIVALLVNRLNAHWVDEHVHPNVKTDVALTLHLSHLGSATEPLEFQVDVAANDVLDGFRLSAKRKPNLKALDADVVVSLRGLHLQPLAGYLRPRGIDPLARELSMEMAGEVRLAATQPGTAPAAGEAAGSPDLGGTVELHNIVVTSDLDPVATLDSLQADIAAVDQHHLVVGKLSVDGVHLQCGQASNGNVRFAGLELARKSQPAPPQPREPFAITLRQIGFQDIDITVKSQKASPPVNLRFAISDLTCSDVVIDPAHPDQPIRLAATFHMPDLAQRVQLSGSARPFAETKTARLTLDAIGIRPELLQPYLKSIGLRSTLDNGHFHAEADCGIDPTNGTLRAELSDVLLNDGDTPLLSWPTIKIGGADFRFKNGRQNVQVDDVEIVGPKFSAAINPDGTFSALGLTGKPTTAALHSIQPTSAPVAVTQPHQPLPRVEVAHLAWTGIHVAMSDQSVTPAVSLQVADAGVEMKNLVFDLSETAAEAQQEGNGSVSAWLQLPGVAERITLQGQLTPAEHALTANLQLSGQGLTGKAIFPYLQPLGIKPELTDGQLNGHLSLTIARTGKEAYNAAVTVQNLHYTDGKTELAAIGKLDIRGFATQPGQTTIDDLELTDAHLHAHRNTDRTLTVAGIRFTRPPQPAPTQPSAPATQPTGAAATVLKKFRMQDATLEWSDESVPDPIQTTANLSLLLDNLTLGTAAPPATIDLHASVADNLQSLHITGTVNPDPAQQQANLTIDLTGMKPGALMQYLPPTLKLNVTDGEFHGQIHAAHGLNPQGGSTLDFAATAIVFRQHGAPDPLLKVGELRVAIPRFDPRKGVGRIDVDELTCSGVDGGVTIEPDGSVALLGMKLVHPGQDVPEPDTPSAGPEEPEMVVDVPPATTTAPAATAAASQPAPSAIELAARATQFAPLLTIKKLSVQLDRLTYQNRAHPGAVPLVLQNFSLSSPRVFQMFGNEPARLHPVELVLQGGVAPVAREVKLDLVTAPLARQPAATIDFSLEGINAEALRNALPVLQEHLAKTAMTDGSLSAHIDAHYSRIDPTRLRFGRLFTIYDATASGVTLKNGNDPSPLLAVDQVHLESMAIAPGRIRMRTIQLVRPQLQITKETDGIHLLGVVLARQESQAVEEVIGTTQPATPPSPAIAPQPPPLPPGIVAHPKPPAPEKDIRLDLLDITGLQLHFEDRTVNPVSILPIVNTDVTVRGLSNHLMTQHVPVRFTALVGAGQVEVPKELQSSGIIGAIGDLGSLIGGGPKPVPASQMVKRDLFTQVTASGVLYFYPQRSGWMKASVSGLQLFPLASEAERKRVRIGGGNFDANMNVEFQGDQADVWAQLFFNDLSLNEPPNGFIVRYLNLPMPVDAVIKSLQDVNGTITLPLQFSIQGKQVQNLGGSLAGAMSLAITKAIAAIPVKTVQTGLSFIGLGGGKQKPEPPVVLTYDAGDTALEPPEQAKLNALIEKMKGSKSLVVTFRSQLGPDDVKVVSQRANPSVAQALNVATHLHELKAQLAQAQAEQAGLARTMLASGTAKEAAAAMEKLREIERQAAVVEDNLDQMYDLTTRVAQRNTDRRTRIAATQLGQQRLAALRQALMDAGVPDAEKRVEMANSQFNPETQIPGQVTATLVRVKR